MARRIEIVHADGSELAPRMYLDLPYPGYPWIKMEVESKYLKTAFSLHKQMGMGRIPSVSSRLPTQSPILMITTLLM